MRHLQEFSETQRTETDEEKFERLRLERVAKLERILKDEKIVTRTRRNWIHKLLGRDGRFHAQ